MLLTSGCLPAELFCALGGFCGWTGGCAAGFGLMLVWLLLCDLLSGWFFATDCCSGASCFGCWFPGVLCFATPASDWRNRLDIN